jgi:hypothetical protein
LAIIEAADAELAVFLFFNAHLSGGRQLSFVLDAEDVLEELNNLCSIPF